MGNLIGNMCKCIVNADMQEKEDQDQEYKKRIETTLSSLDEKIVNNRKDVKHEIEEIKSDIKDTRTDIKEGLKDLKDDIKYYYKPS